MLFYLNSYDEMKLEKTLNIQKDLTDSRFVFSDYNESNEIATVKISTNQSEKYSGDADMVFRMDDGDVYSVWAPLHQYKRALFPDWRTDFSFRTAANFGFPIMQFLDKKGNNICFFALVDFTSELQLKGGVNEGSSKLSVTVTVKDCRPSYFDDYEAIAYCDNRNIPYYEAIADYQKYLLSLGHTPAPVPDSGHRRTYSSWYALQKNITQKKLLEQCKYAKQYGMDTVILDDGWQTPIYDIIQNGDKTAGDWEPYLPKFPDMKGLADDLHNMGMKLILWIGTTMIGCDSKYFDFFNGRFLYKKFEDGTVRMADPRYKDIREWYVDFLTDRMKRWNLDGFKLDFLDAFWTTEESRTDYENMDYPNIGEAVAVMMNEVSDSLRKINPDLLLEYRQSYIGPAMQKTGNLFRVEDCAYGSMFNRINGIDLRLSVPNSAVHSDMLMWDYDASAEGCADQLSNLLFIVPQISVRFDKLPEEHKKVLKFYLDFIDDNIDVLQHGKLVPLNPEAFYPVVYAQKDGKTIAGLYSSNMFTVPDNTDSLSVVNASGKEKIYIDFDKNDFIGRNYVIYNCLGEIVANGTISAVLNSYDIPHNGIIILK